MKAFLWVRLRRIVAVPLLVVGSIVLALGLRAADEELCDRFLNRLID